MFLIWPCIFCIGSRQHFYKRKKKIRRVLVLIKRYQCLKCRAVVTWSKSWFHFVGLSCSETQTAEFINMYLLSYSCRLFNVLNTLAGLNLFTSSWAADTCQTPKEETSWVEAKILYRCRFDVGEQQQLQQQSEPPSVTDTCTVVQIEARNVLNDTMTDTDRLGGSC